MSLFEKLCTLRELRKKFAAEKAYATEGEARAAELLTRYDEVYNEFMARTEPLREEVGRLLDAVAAQEALPLGERSLDEYDPSRSTPVGREANDPGVVEGEEDFLDEDIEDELDREEEENAREMRTVGQRRRSKTGAPRQPSTARKRGARKRLERREQPLFMDWVLFALMARDGLYNKQIREGIAAQGGPACDCGQVSKVIQNCRDHGFLTTTRHCDDGRILVCHITHEGIAEATRLYEKFNMPNPRKPVEQTTSASQ
jgi:hypothetical protein